MKLIRITSIYGETFIRKEIKRNKLGVYTDKGFVPVEEQIKIYNDNNKKIKELKEYEIDLKIGKWLLYFGK